jgi:hypothetical protein
VRSRHSCWKPAGCECGPFHFLHMLKSWCIFCLIPCFKVRMLSP